jgi:hypothetical protein
MYPDEVKIFAGASSEPYGDVIITIIAISYLFRLIIEFTKKDDKK